MAWRLVIAVLESHQAPAEGIEVCKIAGREQLTLDDGEVDLDLVQPTGVDWRMNQNDIGPFGFETMSRPQPTMGGAIVGDKEHAARGTIGFLAHHLCGRGVRTGRCRSCARDARIAWRDGHPRRRDKPTRWLVHIRARHEADARGRKPMIDVCAGRRVITTGVLRATPRPSHGAWSDRRGPLNDRRVWRHRRVH